MSSLVAVNSNICRDNLVQYTKMFPEQKSTTFDKVTELIKVFTQNNPVSQFFATTEAAIKSFALAKDMKYRTEAVRYITASEVAKANAYVELVKTEKQFQTYNLMITKEFQKSIAIIKNQKFISLAEIDANLKIALRNCDIKQAEIIRQITLGTAMFSQNIKLIQSDMRTRQDYSDVILKLFTMSTETFLKRDITKDSMALYKELGDFYFEKLMLLLPSNSNYINFEKCIDSMWRGGFRK